MQSLFLKVYIELVDFNDVVHMHKPRSSTQHYHISQRSCSHSFLLSTPSEAPNSLHIRGKPLHIPTHFPLATRSSKPITCCMQHLQSWHLQALSSNAFALPPSSRSAVVQTSPPTPASTWCCLLPSSKPLVDFLIKGSGGQSHQCTAKQGSSLERTLDEF